MNWRQKYASLPAAMKWFWGVSALAGMGLLAFFLFYGGASAPSAQPDDSASTFMLSLSVLLKLGVVIGLIYASLYLLRRMQPGSASPRPRQLTLVETMHLSPRQKLHMVRVGGQTYLIGATDQALSLLSAVEGLPEDAPAAPQEQPALPRPLTFADILSAGLGKR
ncbi:MAG: flagellar biosynthetic protein FliO [Chloroflexi bacterium]|nr:flagellar biosynthetic protein FliO [Chloroflexota bacterium]